MELKVRLTEILKVKGYTYSDLSAHLQLSENELDSALEEGKLDIQTIEKISKDLQIPLYSFFRVPNNYNKETKPWFTTKLWEENNESLMKRIAELELQVEQLSQELKKYKRT
jgi:transcriptional regulator with XRE-family HTH domain